ncbi:MAG: MFS transporter [Deltaproteobacteria bacterium]|jgi:NNP family nitrate/nitrite transporter-like MFS transporter|nr:MFS transporter [Deltaproteobacteria bacterium]MDH3772843.1 MFS transporter [Deltaproteobacteria bacterium]MDH3800611.1 MFS transporter [Deltaproteobacteria bacterium]MDH3849550.1 MFS transporter [Deltaproteobacteria bacterium]MDH3897457.1 MFS transporter [Deltaproteobacteria bacterium]
MSDEAVCYAQSSRGAALTWTTLAFFAGFAGVSAFGPIVANLKQSMELNPLLVGFLAASPALTGSLLRIPFGAMVDRVGGKKPILILLSLAVAGIAAITLLFTVFSPPQPSHYPLFLMAGMLCGCGIAVFSVGIPTVSYWYPQKKQGTALAIYAGLGNMAPGMFAMALPFLVVSLGFAISYVLWLGMLLSLLIVFLVYMKDAPYFQYKEMGIQIDEDALFIACGEELIPSGNVMESLKRAGSNWRTWILTMFYFVTFGGFIALTVWFPTYWREYFGTSLVLAGFLTALYSLSASILRVFGGFTSDRIGGEKTVFLSFVVVAVGAFLMIVASRSMAMAVSGVILLALGMGFANAAVFKLVPKYTPETVGGAAGIVGGLGAFGGFVIPPVMGLFVKLSGASGYSLGFSVFFGLSLLSLVLFAILNRYAPVEPAAEAAT